jgi:hypothetical protein
LEAILPRKDPSEKMGFYVPPPELMKNVSAVLIEHFSYSAARELNTNVVLPLSSVEKNDFLCQLANFLWAHRHIGKDTPSIN